MCIHGARVVQKDVIDQLIGKPVRTFVVWTPVLFSDTRDDALAATKEFRGTFVEQFWDPARKLGRAYAKVVDLPAKRSLAWDVHFVHRASDSWQEVPPRPFDWMHQLGDDDRRLVGTSLKAMVENSLK